MVPLGEDLFEAELPAVACTTSVQFWVTAELNTGQMLSDPAQAPSFTYSALATTGIEVALRDELEGDTSGWTVIDDAELTSGSWQVVQPIGTSTAGLQIAPDADATTEGVMAFVTQNGLPGGSATISDVDGGPTHLLSPTLDLENEDGVISFAAWFVCDDEGTAQADAMEVAVSNDNGENWTSVMEITGTDSSWKVHSFRVTDFVEPTSTVRVRFSVSDLPNNSITEGGIDNFEIQAILCGDGCTGDLDGNGTVDGADLGTLLAAFGGNDANADLNGDGTVDGADLGEMLAAWGPCAAP